MAFSMRSLHAVSLLPLLVACGSSKPAEPPKTAAAAPQAPLQMAAAAPDLSPLKAPPDLVALGRLARPSSLVSTLAGWVSLPFQPKMLDAIEPGLAEAVAVDAPIEFAVVLPSGGMTEVEPEAVVTIGLANIDKAKKLLEDYNGTNLSEHSPGVWLSSDDSKAHCAVAASLGKTNARLVCGSNAKSTLDLLPYATRGLPLADLGSSDLRAEIRVQPLAQKFAAAARMGKTMGIPALLKLVALNDPKFDRPFADAAHAVGDELIDWFEDLDRITVDLATKSNPELVDAKVGIVYKSHKSLLASAATSIKGRMVSPGPLFFDLPADVTSAYNAVTGDPKLIDKPIGLMNALLDGFLAHIDVNAGERKDLTKAIADVFTKTGSVVAVGDAPLPIAAGKTPSYAEQLASATGCRIIGYDAPADSMKAMLKSLQKLSADKTFKKGIDRIFAEKMAEAAATDSETSSAGKKTTAKPSSAKTISNLVTFKSKTVKGMPAGSEVTALTVELKAAEQLVTETQKTLRRHGKLPKMDIEAITILVAVVPDGARTWAYVTTDEKALVERAKSMQSGSTAPRLSTRSDLGAMRGKNAYRSGFLSLLSLKGYLAVALQAKGKSSKEAETTFSTLPHHGSTPVFYQYVATGDSEHPSLEGTVTIPREVFDDVAAAVPSLMMSF